MSVRVRFAPSPTGSLHIGGARTALFNWLFARKHGGSFILRIDDTDLERSSEESYREILSSLQWLGLEWDEGPYLQSERLELYREAAETLLAEGKAYLCYCTPEELAARRQQAQAEGRAPAYDGRCRDLTPEERCRLEDEGRRPAIRLKVPTVGTTVVRDVVRGEVVFDNSTLDDFIIIKSNGIPTYNFATVVDDHDLSITHVIRAEEHLSNTPKQILVAQALGYDLPVYAHVPMILAPDRTKLSKRHGATSVEEYRTAGYLPEALINYLSLLGWSPEGDQEILPLEEIIRQFSLEKVSKNAAIYDTKKLTWINGHYLRTLDLDKITRLAIPFLQAKGFIPDPLPEGNYPYVRAVVAAVRDRVKTLAEVADAASYFFANITEYEEKGVRKFFAAPGTADLLERAKERLKALEPFTKETTEKAYRDLAEELGIPAGQLIHPTRLAVSGRTMGPGLFDILELLGKDKVIARLEQAIAWIRYNLQSA
ncbi:glutamyl-tRNA synthetase [Thermanaeromonas toyohensis ToBE]|uniref:Glutamate--tRNA ligase n=1 Tax=Thermanaeromonas toyohensis ToBE TaxID=698762 RepID=A0A1W1VWP4_9FIRM|nr:glutamate--tRNA ligase [Thermanaeromonas toyohensis]SMB97673.1 glutamyl-tRNA synthetase [Thermanaeromonas toyohensis ToBE]